MRSSSMSLRTKSKSVFEADGNPTSISLIPSATSRSNIRCFRSESIGFTSAWLPSRRSVEHQIGARSTTRFGHVRSGRSTVGYGRYFQWGMVIGAAPRVDGLLPAVRVARNGYVASLLPLVGKDEGDRPQACNRAAALELEALPHRHRFEKHSERRDISQSLTPWVTVGTLRLR